MKQFNILIVSDIHGNVQELEDLRQYIARDEDEVPGERIPVPDLVLCCGDLTNYVNAMKDDEAETAKAEAEVSQVLRTLENICGRVVYVPGNHEPPCCFASEPPSLSQMAVNAHMKQFADTSDSVSHLIAGSGSFQTSSCWAAAGRGRASVTASRAG